MKDEFAQFNLFYFFDILGVFGEQAKESQIRRGIRESMIKVSLFTGFQKKAKDSRKLYILFKKQNHLALLAFY